MIRDIYKEICTMHKFISEEKNEILACFDQQCKPNSEKGMDKYPKRHMLCHGIQLNHDNVLVSWHI